MKKIMMVAGESSGDLHGSHLLAGIKQLYPNVDVFGIGGIQMVQAGLRPYYMLDSLQVHGLVEILRHLPRLYQILWHMRDAIRDEQPDAVILVDYPGFNLKLARYAKRFGVPVIFFNSPQIWAWRKGRLNTIRQVVDKMLVLYPFEAKIYEEVGMDVSFVGHPALMDSVPSKSVEAVRQQVLAQSGVPESGTQTRPIVVLAPGSRPSELERHLDTLIGAVEQLHQQGLPAEYVIPVADTLRYEVIEKRVKSLSVKIHLFRGKFLECIQVADVAVVASGTATFQTALSLTPFVLVYKVAPVSYAIARRLAQVPFFGMANILAGKQIVPELIQEDFTVENVARELRCLLEDETHRQNMVEELKKVRSQFGQKQGYPEAVAEIHQFLSQVRPPKD